MGDLRIYIAGASGHGKVCAEIAALNGYREILFLDDDTTIKHCGGHEAIGTVADFKKYVDDAACFFVAIGNNKTREHIQYEIAQNGGKIVSLIHPKAVVSKSAHLGAGAVVMAGAVINPDATVGEGCIINTGSTIDHDCVIGDYTHIAVGAHIAGTVTIGAYCWLGAGAAVSNNLTICEGVTIGTGGVAVKDITEPGTYIGVPVKKIR